MTKEQKEFVAARIWAALFNAGATWSGAPEKASEEDGYARNVIVSALSASLLNLPEAVDYPDPEAFFFERQKPLLLEIAAELRGEGRAKTRIFLCRLNSHGAFGNYSLAAAEAAHNHAAAALRGFVNLPWRQRGAVIAKGDALKWRRNP